MSLSPTCLDPEYALLHFFPRLETGVAIASSCCCLALDTYPSDFSFKRSLILHPSHHFKRIHLPRRTSLSLTPLSLVFEGMKLNLETGQSDSAMCTPHQHGLTKFGPAADSFATIIPNGLTARLDADPIRHNNVEGPTRRTPNGVRNRKVAPTPSVGRIPG